VFGQIVEIRQVLSLLFQRPNFLHLMKSHYNELMSNNIVCNNFVQGQLWKSQVSYFDNKTVFSIFIYFDDYETGNALGSHSGKNKLGAVYFSLPSIPQKLNKVIVD